jgi:hypothetical protein
MLAFQCKYDLDARCNFSFIGDKNTPTIEECKLCVEIRQMKLEKDNGSRRVNYHALTDVACNCVKNTLHSAD